jgi:hypothetical protein
VVPGPARTFTPSVKGYGPAGGRVVVVVVVLSAAWLGADVPAAVLFPAELPPLSTNAAIA